MLRNVKPMLSLTYVIRWCGSKHCHTNPDDGYRHDRLFYDEFLDFYMQKKAKSSKYVMLNTVLALFSISFPSFSFLVKQFNLIFSLLSLQFLYLQILEQNRGYCPDPRDHYSPFWLHIYIFAYMPGPNIWKIENRLNWKTHLSYTISCKLFWVLCSLLRWVAGQSLKCIYSRSVGNCGLLYFVFDSVSFIILSIGLLLSQLTCVRLSLTVHSLNLSVRNYLRLARKPIASARPCFLQTYTIWSNLHRHAV